MTDVVLCPNCGGAKNVSKPPYIAGDVNSWVGSGTPTYPCPTCDGRGWIRVDDVSQGDFDNVKFVALSSMETAENLMDECTKRADRIKELEAELEYMVVGEREADYEIGRMRAKISEADDKLRVMKEMRDELLEDWEEKRYTVVQLESRIGVVENQRDHMSKIAMKNLSTIGDLRIAIHKLESAVNGFRAVVGEKDLRISALESYRDVKIKVCDIREDELTGIIDDLVSERERDDTDIELLDEIMKIVSPLIRSGAYAKPSAESRLLAIRMNGLCQTVVQYRRKHNIVG